MEAGPLLQPDDVQVWDSIDDRYQVFGRLAKGERALVFAATDWGDDGPPVALKLTRHPYEGRSYAMGMEVRAREALAGEAGIVAMRGVGIAQIGEASYQYLTTELAERGSLKDALIRGEHGPEMSLTVMRSIIPAVATVHRHGLIHRDLKPENVLAGREPGEWLLNDFDLARRAGQASLAKSGAQVYEETASERYEAKTIKLVLEHTVEGTVGYIAPELLTAEPPQKPDEFLDAYAAGVIGYEAAAGEQPFRYERDNLTDYAMAVTRESPVPLSALVRAIPAELDHLIMACLEPRPENRPTDEEALRALETI